MYSDLEEFVVQELQKEITDELVGVDMPQDERKIVRRLTWLAIKNWPATYDGSLHAKRNLHQNILSDYREKYALSPLSILFIKIIIYIILRIISHWLEDHMLDNVKAEATAMATYLPD